MSSRLDQWIDENKPREPQIGVGTSLEQYEREWARYRVDAREYQRKLAEVVRRHGPELDQALNDHLEMFARAKRTFEIREKGD